MTRWPQLALLLLLTLPAITARAAPRVIVEIRGGATALGAPLRAELGSLGFEVIEAPAEDLDALARAEEASFALAITPREGGYEIWLRDRVTSKTLIREVVAASESSVVLAAVELVRASLLELRARHAVTGEVAPDETLERMAVESLVEPPPRAQPPPEPAPAREKPASSSPERTIFDQIAEDFVSRDLTVAGTLEVGAVWMHETATGESAIGVELGGGWFWPRNSQGRFFARYHSTTSVELREGTIDLYTVQLGLSSPLHLLEPSAPISPFVEPGVMATLLHVDAVASAATLVGREESHVTMVPFIGLGLSAGASHFPVRVRFVSGLGVAVPEIRLLVNDEVVGSYGRPLFFATLSAQYAFAND